MQAIPARHTCGIGRIASILLLTAAFGFTGMTGAARAQGSGAGSPVAIELTPEQKMRIRIHIDDSRRKLEASMSSPTLQSDTGISATLELARDYLNLLEDTLLAENGPLQRQQFENRLLRLMQRTETSTGALENRLSSQKAPDELMQQVRAARERLVRNRQQLEMALAMSAAGRAGAGALDPDSLLDRAQSNLDSARETLHGIPDAPDLNRRVDLAQERLDAARLRQADTGDEPAPR